MNKLSHVDQQGQARMVDVGDKSPTGRTAIASGEVHFPAVVWQSLIEANFVAKKGSIIQTAIIAGTMAVKRTADLIPLCHPLALDTIHFDITPAEAHLRITCTVRCHGRTGVEMEALTGVSVAALTVYDMTKAVSPEIVISNVQLDTKTGGKHDYQRTP